MRAAESVAASDRLFHGVAAWVPMWSWVMIQGVTTGDMVAIVLAFLGFVGTTSMLIMNLKITSAFRQLEASFEKELAKVELRIESSRVEATKGTGAVQLELSNLRTKLAEELSNLYNQVMKNMESSYMNRDTSTAMHAANQKRLDVIEQRLSGIEQRLPG